MGRRAKSVSIKIQSTDDGLHLSNSILWFDSHVHGELSFLSSAMNAAKTHVPQVIATEETVKILESYRRRPNALICQYNRPFSIGRLKLELLPSGCVLGGASLYVETDEGRLLYAPQIQTQRIPTVRQLQLRRADTLIIGASYHDPALPLPNRKKEKDRLIADIEEFMRAGKFPVIFCQPIGTGQEICKLLTDLNVPIAVHSSIFRVNKVCETYGSPLGRYSLYSRHTRNKVVVFPSNFRLRYHNLAGSQAEGPMLMIDNTIGDQPPAEMQKFVRRYCMSATSDGNELKEVVSAVSPKELYIFGVYTKAYEQELKGSCPVIKPLFPNDQPTLF